ncbi:MAG TPA: ABC transporter permease [Symbiobacteriaceae bacterium]|nr:ABC transporter permease [Symbiobacteriaceae bacterium]
MISDLIAVWSSARSQIGNSMARTMMKNVVFVSPLMNVLIAYYLFRRSGLANFGEHVVIGSGLMTLWGTILWSSATDIGRERWMGTLEILLIAPVRFPTVLLGKILGNTLLGVLAVSLSWFYARVLLGVRMTVAHPGLLLVTLGVAIFAFVGFALMLALLFTLSRNANAIANGLGYPLYVVSGLLFPLTVLPVWVLPFGLSLPLAWAREALRWATTGAAAGANLLTPSWAVAAGGLLAVGIIYFVAAYGLYRYVIDRKLRQLGQLGVS